MRLDKVALKAKDVCREKPLFGRHSRYFILAVATLCLTTIVANCMAFTFTVICMRPGDMYVAQSENANTTSPDPVISEHGISASQEGYLFSAVAVGIILGTFPFTYSVNYLGFKTVFAFCGLLSCVSTLLLPWMASLGFVPLLVIRLLQGIPMAASYPAMSAVSTAWSTLEGQGIYLAIISCHIQLAQIFTMPMAGELCQSRLGWPATFYILSGVTALAFMLHLVFYSNSPERCWFVTAEELKKLEEGKDFVKRQPLPVTQMLQDSSVWALFLAGASGAVAFQIFAQYGPTYFSEVLEIDVTGAGFLITIPYIASMLAKLVVGPIVDRCSSLSVRMRVVLLTFYGQLVITACFLLLAWATTSGSIALAQVAITVIIAGNGFSFIGLAKNAVTIARHHSYFIMAVIALTNSIVVIVLPSGITFIAPDFSPHQWTFVFYLAAGLILVANFAFFFMAKTEARSWSLSNVSSRSQIFTTHHARLPFDDLKKPSV